MPKVSVLIPTYNRHDLLKEALESLTNQTSQDFEVIVLDHGDMDQTKECAEKYKERLPSLRYIKEPVNPGTVVTLGHGLLFAEGKYIKYLLDSDMLQPDCIKVMSQCLDEFPQAALITSKRALIDVQGQPLPDILSTRPALNYDALIKGKEFIKAVLSLKTNVIGGPSAVMFRKECVREPYGFLFGQSYSIHADISFWFRLLMEGDGIYLITPLSYFRLGCDREKEQGDHELIEVLEWIRLARQMRSLGYLEDTVYQLVLEQNMPQLLRLKEQNKPEQGKWRSILLDEIAWIESEKRALSRNGANGEHREIKKVLIIYPKEEGFNTYYQGADRFNHSAGIISAVLKPAGYEVNYLDFRKMSGWEEVERYIKANPFDLAFITVEAEDIDAAQKAALMIKEKDRHIKVMVGGSYPTLESEKTALIAHFDYVFTYEAGSILPKILKTLSTQPKIIQGEKPEALSEPVIADRSLSPQGETVKFLDLLSPHFSVMASYDSLSHRFSTPEGLFYEQDICLRNVDHVLDELEYLEKHFGMKSFMILGEPLIHHEAWVEEFCAKKIERGLNQPFACQITAPIICKRPDLIGKLADAGLKVAVIGFASGSDRVLQLIKKDTTVRENLEAARICHELGIKICAQYMFGVPTETKDEMRCTALMIQAVQPHYYDPVIYTPIPGSSLYEYCEENKLLIAPSDGEAASARKWEVKGIDYNFVREMIALSMAPLPEGNLLVRDNHEIKDVKDEKNVESGDKKTAINDGDNADDGDKKIRENNVTRTDDLVDPIKERDGKKGTEKAEEAETSNRERKSEETGEEETEQKKRIDESEENEKVRNEERNQEEVSSEREEKRKVAGNETQLRERETFAEIAYGEKDNANNNIIEKEQKGKTGDNEVSENIIVSQRDHDETELDIKIRIQDSKTSSLERPKDYSISNVVDVSVIIVTFNNLNIIKQCLSSVWRYIPKNLSAEIIVVDNGSTDGTKDYLSGLTIPFNWIDNPTNYGLARACNQGSRTARGKYLLFLNSGIVIKNPWLHPMVKRLENNETVGIVGCKILNQDDAVYHAGIGFTDQHGWFEPVYVYKGFKKNLEITEIPRKVQGVSGNCLLMRKELFDRLGGFDEGFVNGLEDIDLCLSVREMGYEIWFEPGSNVYILNTDLPPYAQQDIQRFKNKWEEKGIIEIDAVYTEQGYIWNS